MKKNGFIATSILYSFFLVFLTLFLALVTNYLHNQNLIRQVNEESKERLAHINNYKLSDLEPGNYLYFKTRSLTDSDFAGLSTIDTSNLQNVNFLNDNVPWVYAYSDSENYVFISSSRVINETKNVIMTINNFPVSIRMSTAKAINETVNGNNTGQLRNILGFSILTRNINYGADHNIEVSLLNLEIFRDLIRAINLDTNRDVYDSNTIKNIMADIDDSLELVVSNHSPFTDDSNFVYYSIKRTIPKNEEDITTNTCGISGLSAITPNNLYTISDSTSTKPEVKFVGYSDKEQNNGVINSTYDRYVEYCFYSDLNNSIIPGSTSNGNRLYLKIPKNNADIKIESGAGTMSNPFVFDDGK